jgi:hypothetical protein
MCNPSDNRCYKDPKPGGPDSTPPIPIDAPPSAGCVARRLLTGGMPVEQQGWTIERVGSGTVSYGGGMTTLTTTGSARQLLVLRDAFPPDRWSIQVTGEITSSGGCTASNAAIALMASFHDPAGSDTDRARMLCLTEDKVMWGDGTGSVGIALNTTGTIRLERTASAAIRATVQSGAGMASMTGGSFTSNGTLAIGDQSMDLGLESSFKIVYVDLMCP